MIRRSYTSLGSIVVLCLLTCPSLVGNASAQDAQVEKARPMYALMPAHVRADVATPAAALQSWNGSFTFSGKTYTYNMVGATPSTNTTATITTFIIPVKITITARNGSKTVFDPSHVLSNGNTVTTNTLDSPIFDSTTTYTQGGVDVGTTQYIDAFQRANFWSVVSTSAPDYHVSFTATVKPTQTIRVPRIIGSTSPGPCARIGQVHLLQFDSTIRRLITSLGIPPTSLPLFVSYNTFLTEAGCCILGYHSLTTGSQTYAFASYSDPGIFDVPIEDIHAMSHELGEWLDDPLVNNQVPAWKEGQATSCQRSLEVGDPVTGIAFTASLNGTDYHPEDLVFLPWFARGSPSSSVNGWYTFLDSFPSPPPACH